MSVLARPLGVVVHRVIVHRDRLERRGMGVGQGAAGGPEHLADAQVLERPGRDDQERVGVEVGTSSHRALSALEMILTTSSSSKVIVLVDGAEHNVAFYISVCFDYGARYFARQLDRAASVAGNIAHVVHAHQAVNKLTESAGVPTNPAA